MYYTCSSVLSRRLRMCVTNKVVAHCRKVLAANFL